jgi:Nucleotidyl transferase AbiEii toxin, Type IV TA system
MPQLLDPRLDILPAAQKEIWTDLSAAPRLSLVLYGGTAVALHLGHRQSVDFDFFRADPLDKAKLREAFPFLDHSMVLQDAPDTFVVLSPSRSGNVKISFFGRIGIGRVREPLLTRDRVLLIASLDDLMATKLKVILDRAEARDYRDIAEMIAAGVSLSTGLGAFKKMFNGDPSQVLRAIGYFKDGDLPTLAKADQDLLRNARDQVIEVPDVQITPGTLAIASGS